MAAELRYFGDEIIKNVRKIMCDRLNRVGLLWVGHASIKLGERINRDGKNPGPPGGFPAQAEPQLKKDVDFIPCTITSKLQVTVGTNLEHGRFQELGTKFIKPRPWMSLTTRDTIGRIKRILGAPI